MAIKNNKIDSRPFDIIKEINPYRKRMIEAFKIGLYFAADEYACVIYNNYLYEDIFLSDKDLLIDLIHILYNVGNYKNGSIVEKNLICLDKENSSIKNQFNISHQNFSPLITENLRAQIRHLDINEKYSRDFDKNFKRALSNFHIVQKYKKNLLSKPSLLDIGPGYGFFPYICKHNEYDVSTIDIKNIPASWNNSIKILGIPKTVFSIEKFKPLPPQNKFDVITGFQICFNGHLTKNLWGINEWKFFLKDMYDNFLNKDGFILLMFNYENTQINNEIINLGDKSLENFFSPFFIKEIEWKTALLYREDIKTILSKK